MQDSNTKISTEKPEVLYKSLLNMQRFFPNEKQQKIQ